MHRGCHNSLHKRGVPFTAEHRANMATSRIGFRHTAEAKAKIGAARLGKSMSAETRAKISASKVGKKRAPYSDAWKAALSESRKGKSQTHFQCGECELTSSGGGIYQHQKATGHGGKIPV
jgi:plasmid stability protein